MQTSEHVLLNGLLLLLLNAIGSKGWSDTESTRNALTLLSTVISRTGGKIANRTVGSTEVAPIDSSGSNCIKMQCTFVCFNGKSSEIAADIRNAAAASTYKCSNIDELRLYSYQFEGKMIAKGFLQEYGNKVKNLYIACSDVTDVEGGAFGDGIFRQLHFEDLRLNELRKDFFESISWHFESLTIVQKEYNMQIVYADFLDYVKYQILYLTLQVGLSYIQNVTASDNLLNALLYADFRYNNFDNKFTENTFSQLSMVEHLDLSHSRITYLPEYIFADIAPRLDYLDLSYNQLTTITPEIFGWQGVSTNLRLILHNNNWHCTCQLHQNMKQLYNYITVKSVLCSTPMRYHNWSVFDWRLCYNEELTSTTRTEEQHPATLFTTSATFCADCGTAITSQSTVTSQSLLTTAHDKIPIRPYSTSTMPAQYQPTDAPNNDDVIEIVCLSPTASDGFDKNSLQVKKALIKFDIEPDVEQVYVQIRADSRLNDSYGLLWFSSVTKQYYKMLINYNDYGLGCYGSISYNTIIGDLEPGECYTICVILKQQMTISPFNCKSIRTLTNLYTNEWLTEEAVEKGIALVVFGIIGFAFIGIVVIYLLLKRKPTLLKGSKRVTTSSVNPDEIVVFPKEKTLASMKHKQELLAKRCSRSTIACVHRRRGSDDSTVSYQSYMNTNLYEVIPSYLKFNNENSYTDLHGPSSLLNGYELPPPIPPPLPPTKPPNLNPIVSYAEIPNRTKRTSDDPLPELPADQEPLPIDLSERFSIPPAKTNCTSDRSMDSEV